MVLVGQVIGDNSPQHITLQSKPWRAIEAFKEARSTFDRWWSDKDGVLKTIEDWNAWEEYFNYIGLRNQGEYAGRGSPVEQFRSYMSC